MSAEILKLIHGRRLFVHDSGVLRTSPFGSLNRRICGSALLCPNFARQNFTYPQNVYSNPELVLPLSERWIKSENKWIRRFGVVSLRGYKRIQITDKVFEILDLVMEDKDKDIKKAGFERNNKEESRWGGRIFNTMGRGKAR